MVAISFNNLGSSSDAIQVVQLSSLKANSLQSSTSDFDWESYLAIGHVDVLVEGGNPGVVVRSVFLDKISHSGSSFFIFAERHRTWETRSFFCAIEGHTPVQAQTFINTNTEWIRTQGSVRWLKARFSCHFANMLSVLPSRLYLLVSKQQNHTLPSFTSPLDFFTLPIKVTYPSPVNNKKKIGLCSGVWRQMRPWYFAEIPTKEFMRHWFNYHFSIGISVIFIYYAPRTIEQWMLDLFRDLSSTNHEIRLYPWEQIAFSEYMDKSSKVWAFSKDTAYADCLFRSRNEFEWISFLDLDEFLATNPAASSIQHGLLQEFAKPSISAVLMYWFIFYPECEDQGEDIQPLWKRFPWFDPAHRNTKFIVKPTSCSDVGAHQPFDCTGNTPMITTNYTYVAHTTYQGNFKRVTRIRQECEKKPYERDRSLITKDDPRWKKFSKYWRHEVFGPNH